MGACPGRSAVYPGGPDPGVPLQSTGPADQHLSGTPLGLRLGWVKVSESIGVGSSLDRLADDGDQFKDTDRFLGVLSYDTDAIKSNIFYVAQVDDGTGGSDGDGTIDNFDNTQSQALSLP